MKRLIRWALNHLPRTFLQRIAGISVPVLGWFYIGRGVECPVCGTRRRKFLPYGYVHSRPNALCPRCLSLERHRLLTRMGWQVRDAFPTRWEGDPVRAAVSLVTDLATETAR